MERRFRIRRVGGKNKAVSVLTVPAEVAKQLDPELEFTFRVTDAGLLYEPVEGTETAPELPAWATGKTRAEPDTQPPAGTEAAPRTSGRGQSKKESTTKLSARTSRPAEGSR